MANLRICRVPLLPQLDPCYLRLWRLFLLVACHGFRVSASSMAGLIAMKSAQAAWCNTLQNQSYLHFLCR